MKTTKKKIKIIYVAGNGHSGSTLLDILLGKLNEEDIFSAGELTFICRDTILNEQCSCGFKIKDCNIWSQVYKDWNDKIDITKKEFIRLRAKYDTNSGLIKVIYNSIFPSKDFKKYAYALEALFISIKKVTGKSIIIDSSKAPTRILVLSTFAELKVIHLLKDFSGVLNSAKRDYKKNIEKGYEEDLLPRKTNKALFDWLLNNFLVSIFSIRKEIIKIHYKEYVNNVDVLNKVVTPNIKITSETLLNPKHLLAGNVIRLNKKLKLNPSVGFNYKKLTKNQKRFASIIDSIFFFWSK